MVPSSPTLARFRFVAMMGLIALFTVPSTRVASADPDPPYTPPPAGPHDFHRGAPYAFHAHGGQPRERLLGNGRTDAWVANDGVTMITGSGSAGSLIAGGTNVPLNVADVFDASFSTDMRHAAIAQARTPLVVIDVPSGAIRWQSPQGRTCKSRWMSPTVLIAHDYWQDSHLWRIDFATTPPHVEQLGAARRADACWASPDGRTWLVRDDSGVPGGVVWVINGLTGVSSALVQGFSFVVGSPIADRACVQRADNTIDCIRVHPRTVDTVFRGGSFDSFSNIDDAGARLMFGAGPNVMVADFATRTVRAAPGVKLPSGGSIALLSGGHILATGSSSATNLYNLDAGTLLTISSANPYTAKPVWRRPHSVIVAREQSSGWDLYLDDLPP